MPNNPDFRIEQFVTDTFFVADLKPNSNYFWKIKASNDFDGCAPASPARMFRTAPLDEIPELQVSALQASSATCPDASDASITVEITGGNPPYNLAWEDGTDGPTLSGVPEGNYDLLVSDASGLQQILTFYLGEPDELEFEVTVEGDNTARVSGIKGGTAPYTVTWSNGEEGMVASDLPLGVNSVTVQDANGCEHTIGANVITVTAEVVNPLCANQNTGAILVNEPSGGVPPFTYTWSSGQTSAAIYELAPNTYFLTLEDAVGTQIVQAYVVNAPQELQAQAEVIDNNVIVTAIGGTTPFSIAWEDETILGFSPTDLDSGTYGYTITDGNGCSIDGEVDVYYASTENLNKSEFYIFPNPLSSGPLNLQFSTEGPTELMIYGANGQVHLSKTFPSAATMQQHKIDVASLPAGLYFVQLTNNNSTQAQRLTIAH